MTAPKFIVHRRLLLAAILAVATSPASALAKDVELPAGDLNGAGGSCSVNATSAILMSEHEEHIMTLGDRLAFPAKKGDDWRMKCTADGLTITTGTGCFYDGYIVAGFEREAMAISCYEGQIPENLK